MSEIAVHVSVYASVGVVHVLRGELYRFVVDRRIVQRYVDFSADPTKTALVGEELLDEVEPTKVPPDDEVLTKKTSATGAD